MIYSPSQTDTHGQCPIKRALRYAGWTARGVGKRDLAAILGTAIAAGLAEYNTTRANQVGGLLRPTVEMAFRPGLVGPADVARNTAIATLAVLPQQGRHIEDWDQSQANSIERRAGLAVERYIAADPIPPEWPILAVEELLPSGQARPDLVVDDGRGPVAIDYKTKLTLKPEYEDREMARWAQSWQMLHYSWELKADHFYICLLVLEPRFRVQLIPFEVHPETMGLWGISAKQRWADMRAEDEGRRQPAMATAHVDAYGPCEFQRACFECRFDPEKMREHYVQVARGR
jgi:hypothetical protein